MPRKLAAASIKSFSFRLTRASSLELRFVAKAAWGISNSPEPVYGNLPHVVNKKIAHPNSVKIPTQAKTGLEWATGHWI
jgi:hypothetical protein